MSKSCCSESFQLQTKICSESGYPNEFLRVEVERPGVVHPAQAARARREDEAGRGYA